MKKKITNFFLILIPNFKGAAKKIRAGSVILVRPTEYVTMLQDADITDTSPASVTGEIDIND